MTAVAAEWTATITLRPPDSSVATALVAALRPEAAREVPRSTAEVSRDGAGGVTIKVLAHDAGAMRAAMNTYLGWIDLALAAARAARAGTGSPSE